MKAIDFWNVVCNEFEFRFFSGVPSLGFNSLYNSMNSDLMYYIPAVSEDVALGVCNGMTLTGVKSAVFCNGENFDVLLHTMNKFNFVYELPAFIILDVQSENVALDKLLKLNKIPCRTFSNELFDRDIKYLSNKFDNNFVVALKILNGAIE